MSWSDHKDDKSRFDGWREFLNEGERVPYKSINLDNPESFKQSYRDVIRSRVLGLPKGSSYRKRISTTVEGLDKKYGDVSNEEGKEYTLSNLAMGLEQVNGEWKRRRDEWRLRRNLDDLEDLHALLHKELYPEDYKTYKAEYEDLGGAGYALKESQLQQIIREELTKILREGPTRPAPRKHPLRGTADPHTQAFDDFIEALKAGAEIHGDALTPTEEAIINATEPLLNGVILSDDDRARLLGTLEPLRNMINSGNFDNAHLIDLAAEAHEEMAKIENKAHLDNFVDKVTSEHTEMIRARQLLQGIDDIDYIDAVIERLGGEVAPLQDETIAGEFERKIAWIMDAMASKISTPRHER